MKKILVLMVALVFLSATAFAAEVSVSPIYWWNPNLDGTVSISKAGVGQKVDFVDDLDMEDESIPGVSVEFKLGTSSHFMLSYWSMGYNGSNTLTQAFDFNGKTYTAGSTVKSSFDLNSYGLGYAFDLLDFGSFHIGPMLDLNFYAMNTELSTNDPSIPLKNNNRMDLLLPFAGVRFGASFMDNKVELGGEFSGLWWQGNGFWKGSAMLSYYPIKNLGISAGYRMIHLDLSEDGNGVDLKLDGPTLSATFRF